MHIGIAEDDPDQQVLLQLLLQTAGHSVVVFGSVAASIEVLKKERVELLVVDWMLPDVAGTVLARKLRADARSKDIPSIMVTARAQEQDKIEGLDAGADDYITKPFSPKELMARIKAVLRRRSPQLTDDLIDVEGLQLDPGAHRVSSAGKELRVGPTEFKLLHFFMTHPERVYSRMQLLDQVWGDHVFVEERTVDVHIRRLRQALEPTGHDRLIETVRGSGYRLHG